MAFPWPKDPSQIPTPSIDAKPSSPNPFLSIQNHLTTFLTEFSTPSSNPNPKPNLNLNSLKTHLQSALEGFGSQARQALQLGISRFAVSSEPAPLFLPRSPVWARMSAPGPRRSDLAMSAEDIEERLAGVPVYALSNAAEEFVLVSGVRTGKSLGLFCFRKEDAEALLDQMKSMNQDVRQGSKVVAVALNKVFQLKVDGVAFRFIPDSCQIANAIKVKEKAGDPIDSFTGVPVFQSRSLVLKSRNKRYRPVFFRKEDLEDSLSRASRQQRKLNPALRQGDIQVCVLEEIIEAMRVGSTSKWDDMVFIPPGFNVSTDLTETGRV